MRLRVVIPMLSLLLLAPLSAADSTYTYSSTNTFTPTMVDYGGSIHSGTNCVRLEGTATDVTGTVTATWDALTPLAERLEIVFRLDDEDGTRYRVDGPSPLTLSVADLTFPEPEFFGATLVAIQATTPGVVIEQPIEVAIDLAYTAEAPIEDGISGCALG